MSEKLVIDLTWAKNALFVRQTIAKSFGVTLDREFTWDSLQSLICFPGNPHVPEKIVVNGMTGLSCRIPMESKLLMDFLKALRKVRPDIQIDIRIN